MSTNTSLQNKFTIIIGGSKGTGRAVAELLAKENHTVSVVSRSIPENKISGVNYIQLDLETEGDKIESLIGALCDKFGSISNLIFSQRYRGKGDDWQGEFKVSIDATKRIIDAATPHFAKSASVVVVSSVASKFILYQQPLSYHVAKAAVEKIVQYYAVKLGPNNVRVNAVLPGTILKDENKEYYLSKPEIMKLYSDCIPLGRMISSHEIAKTINFLCSENASAVTGQMIAVDGGMSLLGQESFMLKKLS